MKLTWHIIKKDIMRERWALVLWGLLFVAQAGVGFQLLGDPGSDKDWITKAQLFNGLLVVAQAAMGYLLVARWVHADPLHGTDMFWATRPITRGRLLGAKAAGVLLVFGVLPVLLLAPWWLFCGFSPRDVAWAAVDTMGWQLLMIAPAFLIASMADDLGRVLLWSILLFVAVMTWVVILSNVFRMGKTLNDPTNQFIGVAYSRMFLSSVVFLLCCAAISVHQYMTRRLRRSLWLTLAGLGVVAIVGLSTQGNWTMPLARLPLKTPAPEVATALSKVRVEAGRGLPDTHVKPRAGAEPTNLLTEVYFLGLPPDTRIAGGTARQSWRWADGQTIRRSGFVGGNWTNSEPWLRRSLSLVKPADDPETVAWRKERMAKIDRMSAANWAARGKTGPAPKGQKYVQPARPEPRTLLYSGVPSALSVKAQKEAPAYEATLNCVVTEPTIIAELPLSGGAQGGRDSMQARLVAIRQEPVRNQMGNLVGSQTLADMLFTTPAQRVSGLWLVYFFSSEIRNPLHGQIMVVNRTTGDIGRGGSYSLQFPKTATIGGVQFSWESTQLGGAMIIRDGKWVERDPQWREHGSLVITAEETVDFLTASVRADRIEFLPSLWEDADGPGLTVAPGD